MDNIIINGASSFLGKHFIKRLISEKIPVIVICRESSNISFCEGNSLVQVYRYRNNLSEINIDNAGMDSPILYEFTWYGVFGADRNLPEQLSINIPLVISSVNFAHQIKARHWIGIGSQAEYGNLNIKIKETDECKPTTMYGKAKLHCSRISSDLCSAYKIEHSWLRLFSVFGPDDNHEWLIQYLIKELLNNNDVNVTKAEQYWDYLYVDDIMNLFLKLIDSNGIGILNLGSGKAIQLKYIIQKIQEITKSTSKIHFGALPYRNDQVMFLEANIDKLRSATNWEPKISFELGILETIKYYRNKIVNNDDSM